MIKIIFKNRFFHVFIVLAIIIITAISNLDSFVEIPSRPVREYATMTMALNPDKTESVYLKIPWGYLAPDISYMSAKDQKSFFSKAKAMMLLMGLSGVDKNKGVSRDKLNKEDALPPKYTTAYSIDVLYPTFEAKDEHNIDQFIGKRGEVSKVIRATIYSSAKGHYWDDWKQKILSSYNIYMSSFQRKINESKRFKHYGFSIVELPSQHGLVRRGLPTNAVNELREEGLVEGAIPKDFWEYRNAFGELESYMQCMQPDKGWTCKHIMHVASINSRVVLSYHLSLLKDWQHIESKTRLLFKKFIELGKEHNNG